MDKDEYKQTQEQLILAASLINDLDLEEFIRIANNALSVGMFIDPTAFMGAHEKVAVIKRLAEKALEVKKAFIELQGVYGIEVNNE